VPITGLKRRRIKTENNRGGQLLKITTGGQLPSNNNKEGELPKDKKREPYRGQLPKDNV
jgi:hypothetical protein